MQSKAEGKLIMVKLEMGDDVLESLKKIADQYKIESGAIGWGIGRIRDLEVGYYDGKEYIKKVMEVPLEILSLSGTISVNEPRFHIHVTGAGPDHIAKGGHLFSGVADPLLELQVRVLTDVRLERKLSEKSNLKELEIS